MWCCVYWYITCCHHLQVRRNERKCRQHVFPRLWCLSTNPWVCDITFQKTTIVIVIYIQWISGFLPLKTKVNWKIEAYYSVPFIFQVWAIIMTFIQQSKQHSRLKYHTKTKNKNWKNFGNSIWNIIIEIYLLIYIIPDS